MIDATTGAPDPRHPMAAGMLRRMGVDPESVLADERWGTEDRIEHRDDSARAFLRHHTITIHYAWEPDDIVLYLNEDIRERRPAKWIHQLEFRNWMPNETVLAALPGRRVADLIELPGADRIRILDAEEMGRGLVLTLDPTPIGHPA